MGVEPVCFANSDEKNRAKWTRIGSARAAVYSTHVEIIADDITRAEKGTFGEILAISLWH